MAMEALSSSEMLNFIIYDTISATPYSCNIELENAQKREEYFAASLDGGSLMTPRCSSAGPETAERRQNLAVQGRKKRRRRPKVCKNKEEAETQRMTHITVERNRRKQMNEHLAVLRSLMPESYIQRGDQASIVGGAIDFVKELEHILQSLEAQKFQLLQEEGRGDDGIETTTTLLSAASAAPFAQFFAQPQYYMSSCSTQSTPNKYYNYRCSNNGGIAEIEVTLVETQANIRVLSPKRLRQLSKLVAAFHNLYLTILHLNVTTLDPLVLYSISTKVEEGCQLNSADDIAGAVHHMLTIIEEEAIPLAYADDHDLH